MRLGLLAAIVAALLIAGCSKDDTTTAGGDTAATTGGSGTTDSIKSPANKLVGTWNQTGDTKEAGTAVFNGDGTFTLTSTVPDNGAITIVGKGTYTVESDTAMTRTFLEFEVTGATEEQKLAMSKGLDEIKGKAKKGAIEWTSDSEIKFTDEDGAVSSWKKS